MKVSVCMTVFNEEGDMGMILKSLISQSRKPDEIVIVDGGSTDKTVEVIKSWKKKFGNLRVYVDKGSVAHGRNVSIEKARYGIIATTDAACIAKRYWLEKLIEPFKYKKIEMVAGFYDMAAKNSMQKAMNTFHGVTVQDYHPTRYAASCRSVAFKKKLWRKLGGFREDLVKSGEDTYFFHDAVKKGVKIVRVKEARVVWKETANLDFLPAVKKFYSYARGDAQTKIWWDPEKRFASHNIKILFIFVRYFIGFSVLIFSFSNPLLLWVLMIGIILYILWIFRKVYLRTKDFKAGLWGIPIQFVTDFIVMAGFIKGLTLLLTNEKT